MLIKYTQLLKQYLLNFLYKKSKRDFLLEPKINGINRELLVTQYTYPFEHYIIDNFLDSASFEALHDYFIQEEEKNTHFKYLKLYDLYTKKLSYGENLVSDIFCTNTYKNFVEKLFDLKLSNYHELCFHKNIPNTGDKYVHTDSSFVLFSKEELAGEILSEKVIGHLDGKGSTPTEEKTCLKKRSITMILYLNKDWEGGCGGETGIFTKSNNSFDEVVKIEPKANRILFFKNSDISYHNYKNCLLPSRRSMTQWLYE